MQLSGCISAKGTKKAKRGFLTTALAKRFAIPNFKLKFIFNKPMAFLSLPGPLPFLISAVKSLRSSSKRWVRDNKENEMCFTVL